MQRPFSSIIRLDPISMLVRSARLGWFIAFLAPALLAGCGVPDIAQPKPAEQPAAAAATPSVETWEVLFVQGSKIGYSHEIDEVVTESGSTVRRWTQETSMVTRRFGDESKLGFKIVSWEDLRGRLLRFETEADLGGGEPTRTTGKVVGNDLVLESVGPAHRGQLKLGWPDDAGGFDAVNESLRAEPLKPGEKRTIRALMPLVNQLATCKLSARDYEPTKLLDDQQELLAIDSTLELPGTTQHMTMWADRTGEVLKTHIAAMDQEAFRTTKERALRKEAQAGIDLGEASLVKLAKPIPHPQDLKLARYRVELTDGDPVASFPASSTQSLRRLGPHMAEMTVRAPEDPSKPTTGPSAAPSEAVPTAADLAASPLIEADDPQIEAMAREAAGDEPDAWTVAKRLEAYVNEIVREKNFSQAFSSAAEVARTREGDCTEHAVLLAALARARGIPARVAMGLVYIEPPAFGFHMWTEVYVNDRWVGLDGTLGRGRIGATHLKLASSSLGGADALASFLPLMNVLGQLKIEVLETR
jgi:hypothetical protein